MADHAARIDGAAQAREFYTGAHGEHTDVHAVPLSIKKGKVTMVKYDFRNEPINTHVAIQFANLPEAAELKFQGTTYRYILKAFVARAMRQRSR